MSEDRKSEKIGDPTMWEKALIEAEKDCHAVICQVLGLTSGLDCFISLNAGKVECAVWDIGYPETGETMGFPATTYHFRGQLDLYSRDREKIQRWIMRLLYAFPMRTTQSTRFDLPDGSCVEGLRLAPITKCITEITTTELKQAKDQKGVEAFTATAYFDILFNAGGRLPENGNQ